MGFPGPLVLDRYRLELLPLLLEKVSNSLLQQLPYFFCLM